MPHTCTHCAQEFIVTSADIEFLARVSPVIAGKQYPLLPPVQCPACRDQNRIAFRNEKKLYQRKCDLCRKEIISVYSPDKPHTVYCSQCWWSDNWDSTDSGRAFDFSKTFFEQYAALLKETPLLALFGKNNINSDFVNQETDDKNCYLNAGGHFNQDCYYNTYSLHGKNNVDNYWIFTCELCYMCVHCECCYNSTYLQNCSNVRDSHYCKECKNCDSCFGCYGMSHKQYCFFNEQLSKEAYEEKIKPIVMSREKRATYNVQAHEHFLHYPHEATKMLNCEDSDGDLLIRCKNVHNAFNIEEGQDAKNMIICAYVKDSQDLSAAGWAELTYQIASSMNVYQLIFASHCSEVKDSLYTLQSFNSDHLFGCVGMNRKSYCILNKHYTKDEYEALIPKIIAYMEQTKEWSQFFPMSLSPFAYNETVVQEYFPLNKETIGKLGLKWQDNSLMHRYEGPIVTVPDSIVEVQDDILKQILTCIRCHKNYKIIHQELDFYRQQAIPLPITCLDCRHSERLSLKPPHHLYDRHCQKCAQAIRSTYAPERKEIVYCKTCYQTAITEL